MPGLIDIVQRLVMQEAGVIRSFVNQPRGIFETVDEIIKVARSNAQSFRTGALLQMPGGGILKTLLRK